MCCRCHPSPQGAAIAFSRHTSEVNTETNISLAPWHVTLFPQALQTIAQLLRFRDGSRRPQGKDVDVGPAEMDREIASSAVLTQPQASQVKLSMQQMHISLATQCEWDSPTAASIFKPAVEIYFEAVVAFLNQDPAAECRPWLSGNTDMVSTLDASLMGSSITVIGESKWSFPILKWLYMMPVVKFSCFRSD